jgi:hypothetical protein
MLIESKCTFTPQRYDVYNNKRLQLFIFKYKTIIGNYLKLIPIYYC